MGSAGSASKSGAYRDDRCGCSGVDGYGDNEKLIFSPPWSNSNSNNDCRLLLTRNRQSPNSNKKIVNRKQ